MNQRLLKVTGQFFVFTLLLFNFFRVESFVNSVGWLVAAIAWLVYMVKDAELYKYKEAKKK